MIKVLVAGLVGTIAGIAVMIIVIVASGTDTSGASSVGLGPLPLSTASLSTAPATSTPSGSTGGSTSGGATGDVANGKSIFTGSGGCGGCHTLSAAGTTGTTGPNLDNLQESADKAGEPLNAFIKESIVDPGAYVTPGYQDGIMPTTFSSTLSSSDIDDLVALIAASQK